MKRTCDGCKALEFDYEKKRCGLRYKQEWKNHRPVPAEECPKPRTYKRLFELIEDKHREVIRGFK